MKDNLYKEGEEHFSCLSSYGYKVAHRISIMKRFYKYIVSDITKSEKTKILDIGSGTGYVLVNLAKNNEQIEGVGIDPSQYMVNIGNKLARKVGVENRVKFQLGSSRALPEGNFELAYSTLSFHHWADREKALSDILAHLKDHGEFRIYEFNKDKLYFPITLARAHTLSRDDLNNIALNANVPVSEIKEYDVYISAIFKK
ncbi:MAG: class I SAM-dependent methyltransferase [Thermoplasmata archaeon]